MKYLKKFNESNHSNQIDDLCRKYNIKHYIINEDGTVDVNEDVDLSNKFLTKIPIKFGIVAGEFNIINNQLTSLEGSPNEVYGNFYCSENKLSTLKGGPKSVMGDFYCSKNQLISLEGSPDIVGKNFDCGLNQLTSFEGVTQTIGGGFYCGNNKITSFKGSPTIIKGDALYCNNNKIITLIDCPEVNVLYCTMNPISVIWSIFSRDQRLIYKVNHIYTDLWLGDGWTIQGDVFEQLYEELSDDSEDILPDNWRSELEKVGYKII